MVDDPIPDDLSQAFRETVGCYVDRWTPAHEIRGQGMIHVRGKLHSIAGVCRLIGDFRDPLPDDVLRTLFDEMHAGDRDLVKRLGRDRTYATAASCLLKMVERRVTGREQRQG